jgi:hypothetical protein
MSSMDYFPLIDEAEVQIYKQLRTKILTDQAEHQAKHREEKIELKVALREFEDDASNKKPRRKWHGFSLKKGRNGERENVQQTLILGEPYTYQGTRGYGKLAASNGQ